MSVEQPSASVGDCRICEESGGVAAVHIVGDRIIVGRVCRTCRKEILGVSS